ncbi:hypothetical protein OS493_034385 [Desmophyllum pertusum]|uniref:Uncharacterized protein n=1 Tax=Desmophyllum pertusum TaxID=174260 RepID=A0A9W9ZW71_9CNID|nr:hypothetical protein OS493_034385 [Desmophyllum pertusum]
MPLSSTTGSVSYLVVAASSSAPVSVTHPACLLVQQGMMMRAVWMVEVVVIWKVGELVMEECIRIKFTEKIYERSWPEIRTSMNQKCLDKLKQYLQQSQGSTSSSD